MARVADFERSGSDSEAQATVQSRDKTREAQAALASCVWKLDEAHFVQIFDERTYQSRRFVEELVRLSKEEQDFATAQKYIDQSKSARLTGDLKRCGISTKRSWTARDVKDAREAIRKHRPTTDKALMETRKRMRVYQVS